MRQRCSFLLPSILIIAAGCASQGPPTSEDYQPPEDETASGILTPPSTDAPSDIVAGYLNGAHASETIASLQVTREGVSPVSNLTHLTLGQMVDGREIYNTYAKATLDSRGQLIHIIDALSATDRTSDLTIDADDALAIALSTLHPRIAAPKPAATRGVRTTFQKSAFFYRAPSATEVWVPNGRGTLSAGYVVETWTRDGNLLHETLIGANGRVLDVVSRTNTDSYNIFPIDPSTGGQVTTPGPGAGNAESPLGWLHAGSHMSLDIAGNNVNAYLDRDDNDGADAGGSAITDGNFLAVANLTDSPLTRTNQEVAVQNLFYLNNFIHDKLYRHGFVESARNFQEDNFGAGGLGGDSVNAEAQDGGGTNNANFATPSDGSNPRMQMYIWTQSTPNRDGDLDSDIVYHEYGHGLTWRMIGSMSGAMSGAIGEGMGDVLAILINNDDRVGEYSYVNPMGIRSAAYTNYGRTYGDFGGSSVHFDGEIYAATIWRLWGLFQENGIAQDTLFDYLVGGMNFTPAGPAFEDMRDGILAAAAAEHDCLVWEAFAEFGVGEGARAQVKGGGPFGGRVSVTESFTLPVQCSSCTVTETTESSCDDGSDNDCDGAADCDDSDCDGDPACASGACDNDGTCDAGEDCSTCGDCDGKLNGKPSTRFCCGDGTAQGAEGDGSICDGNY